MLKTFCSCYRLLHNLPRRAKPISQELGAGHRRGGRGGTRGLVGSARGAAWSDAVVSGAKHVQVRRKNWWGTLGHTRLSREMSRGISLPQPSEYLRKKVGSPSPSRRFRLPSLLIPCRKSSFEGGICNVGILAEAHCGGVGRRYKWALGSSPGSPGSSGALLSSDKFILPSQCANLGKTHFPAF